MRYTHILLVVTPCVSTCTVLRTMWPKPPGRRTAFPTKVFSKMLFWFWYQHITALYCLQGPEISWDSVPTIYIYFNRQSKLF